jgi:hypothetical protein
MGALIPLVISLAPEIAKWLFGSTAETVTRQVGEVVATVTGTPDAAAQAAVVARDPEAAGKLRVELARIAADAEAASRKSDMDALAAQLADVANARGQTVALAQAKSAVAYSAPVVSLVVLVTFGLVMCVALTKALPAGSETVLNLLLGSLSAMATSVVSYWVGSSAGSARKDEHLAQLAGAGKSG